MASQADKQAKGPVKTLLPPGCGHTPQLEKRAEVIAAVTDFLRRLP